MEDDQTRKHRIVLRVSQKEKETIEQLALWSDRTVSNYIRKLLGLPEERIGRPPKGSSK
jgi:uncharacterized protein (DUF1778 family)